jgi:uncharacterized protein YjbI with pentapeptide repeats
MANDEHVALLKQGVAAWNEWRLKNPDTGPYLTRANLIEAKLSRADLRRADLSEASPHRLIADLGERVIRPAEDYARSIR